MPNQDRIKRAGATAVVITTLPRAAAAQSEIIDGWTEHLLTLSSLVIVFASLLGIVYCAVSLLRAFKAPTDEIRGRQMLAALFSGTFTIIGVVIGWISGLLIPGT